MNYLLFLYLNLIRGPRLLEERRVKEEGEMVAKIEAERAAGKADSLICKKCDAPIDVLSAARAAMSNKNAEPKCSKCIAEECAKLQAEVAAEMKMTPFLWFQLFVMCAGILVFVHRNFMPLI